MDIVRIAAEAMQRDAQRMESISQNVANVLTPGYKKQIHIAAPSFAQQVEQGMRTTPPVTAPRTAIDATPGTLRYTGNPQDVALDGEGYFEVRTPDGVRYTRQGGLRVDTTGRLVGAQGMPLAGAGGEIALAGAPFTVDADGQVRQGERLAGKLKVVRFAYPGQLQPAGGGLYVPGQGQEAEEIRLPSVRAGYQENSNVNSAQEMVSLSDTVRHFEALSKIMQGYDEVLEKTIRKLGEF